MKSTTLAAVVVAMVTAFAAPAHADPDTDFSHELQGYGIYGPKDYNAWLAKITCERLSKGKDGDAAAASKFILRNLPKDSTQAQSYQFLGASINTYCPDQRSVFDRAAAQQH